MHAVPLRKLLITTVTVLLTLGGESRVGVALAGSDAATGGTWLDQAVAQKQCPSLPVNVPAALLQASSGQALQKQISVVGDTLQIAGTPDPNHIVIAAGGSPGVVRVVFNGEQLGPFGPVARILVHGGDGGDVVIVEPDVGLPTRLEGGAGNNCLQGGSGADQLLSGAGDDVLIAGTGRPALDAGPGRNRVVVPRRMGELWVSPSADARFLRRISPLYTLESPPQAGGQPSQEPPSPIILGPADLADPSAVPLAQRSYDAGQAVAITDATTDDAERLGTLLGHPTTTEGLAAGEKAELIFFRKSPRPGSQAYDYSEGIFLHPSRTAARPARRELDEYSIELLSQVFSATAIVPQPPSDGPSNNLLQIAEMYNSKIIAQNTDGYQTQLSNSVWDARSFQNNHDVYYVLQEQDFRTGFSNPSNPSFFEGGLQYAGFMPVPSPPTLLQASPASTHCTTSTTSGVSYSIGGTVGFNFSQIVNIAGNGGVTISNSKTITCPNDTIYNQGNPGLGRPNWGYYEPSPGEGTLTSFYNQWIWEVPFGSYTSEQLQEDKVPIMANTEGYWPDLYTCCVVQLNFKVKLPFGTTFTLEPPKVASVSPTCVNAGNNFVINGTGFYPSQVTGILINGAPFGPTQYRVTSNTTISVIAPNNLSGYYLPVAVQSAQGLSNTNVTIEISDYGLCQ